MSTHTQTVCDGCDRQLNELTVCLEIRRVDGLCGAGVPDQDTHLCHECARRAFDALKAAPQAATGGEK